MENPWRSLLWVQISVVGFFGNLDRPRPGRFFSRPDLCAYDMRDPAETDLFYRKRIVLAATYREILQVNDVCPGGHEHALVRGGVKGPDGKWVGRGKLSGAYPLKLGLVWGQAIAGAVLRLGAAGAHPMGSVRLSLTGANWAWLGPT